MNKTLRHSRPQPPLTFPACSILQFNQNQISKSSCQPAPLSYARVCGRITASNLPPSSADIVLLQFGAWSSKSLAAACCCGRPRAWARALPTGPGSRAHWLARGGHVFVWKSTLSVSPEQGDASGAGLWKGPRTPDACSSDVPDGRHVPAAHDSTDTPEHACSQTACEGRHRGLQ